MHLHRDEHRPTALDSNRRISGRIHVSHEVHCSLGAVVDLSATGARVFSSKAQCGCLRLEFRAPGMLVQLPAEIVWCKRVGFRQHLLGVRFLEVDRTAAATLLQMASAYRPSRVA